MRLFGSRQAEDEVARGELERLRGEVAAVQSVVRQLETETIAMHDQVRRWMRRAVAAERSALRNQEPSAHVNGSVTPAGPPPAVPFNRISLRGARARIAARRRIEDEARLLHRLSEGEPTPSSNAVPDAEAPRPDVQDLTGGS